MVNLITSHYRTLALVAIQQKTRAEFLTTDQKAILKLLKRWPEARCIRRANSCHCKHGQQWSFIIPPEQQKNGQENCGYYCPVCNFSNAWRYQSLKKRHYKFKHPSNSSASKRGAFSIP